MAAVCIDPASKVIDALILALRNAFDPAGPCPTDDKVAPTVRFFAGDEPPTPAWTSHTQSVGCDTPFVWVRPVKRYRSEQFPDPTVVMNRCATIRVIELEVGVARCAVTEAVPSFEDLAVDAERSLDDSRRVEIALCAAAKTLSMNHQVGYESILPFGPEGGILGWTAQAFISF